AVRRGAGEGVGQGREVAAAPPLRRRRAGRRSSGDALRGGPGRTRPSAEPGDGAGAVEGRQGPLEAGDAGERARPVPADQLALAAPVTLPGPDAPVEVDVGQRQDGAGRAHGPGLQQERGAARVDGAARPVEPLMPATGSSATTSTGMPGAETAG